MCKSRFFEQLLIAFYYLRYLVLSKHRNGHGIHSPSVFDFVQNVLFDRKYYPEYDLINTIRKEIEQSDQEIEVTEIGSGSKKFNRCKRKVSEMARSTSVNKKFGLLLFRMVRYYKPATVIELGTSIGISSLYLSLGYNKTRVITVEGNEALYRFAQDRFKSDEFKNIKVYNALFDDMLWELTEKFPNTSMVFIDGNHNYEATLKYYRHFCANMKEGIIVFDDINWSAGMRRAWNTIVNDDNAYVTIDLFFIGIVQIKQSITPGNYCIKF